MVIPAQYTEAGAFNSVYLCAPVKTAERSYLIDAQGAILAYGALPDSMDEVVHLSATNALFPCEKVGGLVGYDRLISALPVSVTLTNESGTALEVAYTPQNGQLTLTDGTIPTSQRILAACYNESGKFVDIKLLTAGQASAQLEPGTASVKLFWLDGALKPQSTPGSLKF